MRRSDGNDQKQYVSFFPKSVTDDPRLLQLLEDRMRAQALRENPGWTVTSLEYLVDQLHYGDDTSVMVVTLRRVK